MNKTEQQIILDSLEDAQRRFAKLSSTTGGDFDGDGRDFRRAIQECRRIMALREIRQSNSAALSPLRMLFSGEDVDPTRRPTTGSPMAKAWFEPLLMG